MTNQRQSAQDQNQWGKILQLQHKESNNSQQHSQSLTRQYTSSNQQYISPNFNSRSLRQHQTYGSPRQHQTYMSPRQRQTYGSPRQHQTYVSPRQRQTYVSPRQHHTYVSPRARCRNPNTPQLIVNSAPQMERIITNNFKGNKINMSQYRAKKSLKNQIVDKKNMANLYLRDRQNEANLIQAQRIQKQLRYHALVQAKNKSRSKILTADAATLNMRHTRIIDPELRRQNNTMMVTTISNNHLPLSFDRTRNFYTSDNLNEKMNDYMNQLIREPIKYHLQAIMGSKAGKDPNQQIKKCSIGISRRMRPFYRKNGPKSMSVKSHNSNNNRQMFKSDRQKLSLTHHADLPNSSNSPLFQKLERKHKAMAQRSKQ